MSNSTSACVEMCLVRGKTGSHFLLSKSKTLIFLRGYEILKKLQIMLFFSIRLNFIYSFGGFRRLFCPLIHNTSQLSLFGIIC